MIIGRYRKFICASIQRCRACAVYRSQETKIFRFARHCAVAGIVLVAGLIAASALIGPGGPGPSLVKDQPKAQFVRPVRIIPLERPPDEERPLQSTAGAAASATQPVPVSPAPPAQALAPAPTPTFTALTGLPTPEEAARATRIAQAKIAAEKAKRRLARERARARALAAAAAAARSPDQQYFGLQTPDYAYAPRRTYGPFGHSQNGWSNGWSGKDNGWMDRAGR